MDKTTIEIILAVIGIIISGMGLYFYKKNESNESIRHEETKRIDRINNVVREYNKLLRSSKSSDIPALIESGIATLENEGEAKEAVNKIASLQGQRSPLSSRKVEIEKIGILKFFKNFTRQEYMTNKIDEVIKKLQDN